MNNDDSTVEDKNTKVYNDTDRQWTNLDQKPHLSSGEQNSQEKKLLPIIEIDRQTE